MKKNKLAYKLAEQSHLLYSKGNRNPTFEQLFIPIGVEIPKNRIKLTAIMKGCRHQLQKEFNIHACNVSDHMHISFVPPKVKGRKHNQEKRKSLIKKPPKTLLEASYALPVGPNKMIGLHMAKGRDDLIYRAFIHRYHGISLGNAVVFQSRAEHAGELKVINLDKARIGFSENITHHLGKEIQLLLSSVDDVVSKVDSKMGELVELLSKK